MPKVSAAYVEARRNQILDAATKCFARHGVREATIKQICAEADLSAGAIYRYFPSKQAILDAVYARAMVSNRAFVEQIDTAQDPVATISQLVSGMVGFVGDPRLREAHRLSIQVQAASIHQPELADGLRRLQQDVVEQLSPVLRRLQATGRIPDDVDVEYFTWVLLAAYQGLRVQAMLVPELDLERFGVALEQLVDALLRRGAPSTR